MREDGAGSVAGVALVAGAGAFQRRERRGDVEIVAGEADHYAVVAQRYLLNAGRSNSMHWLTVEQHEAGGDPIRQQHLIVEQQVSHRLDACPTSEDRAIAAMMPRNVEESCIR